LTRREGEVLVHLSSDVNTREIAHAMCVSRDTVKSHVRNIYRKLGVASRDHAVAAARTAGILEPQDVR
jgi:LuxR family maltose regulon positive regulatory protein